MMLLIPVVCALLSLTNGQDDSIRFMIVGDWGAEFFSSQREVANAMDTWSAENEAQFVISTGDNFYQWGVESVDDPQFDEKWLDMYNTSNLINLPWYIATGNHDYYVDGNEWYQVEYSQRQPRWILPHLWFTFEKSFGSKKARFVMFDTEALRREKNNHTAMLEETELQLAKPADVKFLIAHREIYGAGDKGPQNGRNYATLQPMMDRHNVPFYICGHDHNLQHITSKDRSINKVDYVISGAGGNVAYLYDEEKGDALRDVYNMTLANFHEGNGFVGVIIDQEQTTFQFYDENSALVYNFTRSHDDR